MSTTTILAVGAAATLGTALIPAAVAVVASPINRARDGRRHTAEAAHADVRAADLVAQIRAGAEYAALAGPDPDKLAAGAYAAAAGLAVWVDHEGHPDDAPLIRRVLNELHPMLTTARVPVPAASPITGAAALRLLLHQLHEASSGLSRVRVSIAAGAAAEAVRAVPDGCVVDFNPLTEHAPEPLRRAQAEWVAVARRAGMGGWIRAVRA